MPRGDIFLPRNTAPKTSWWATPLTYSEWTTAQRKHQLRMSYTHATVMPYRQPSNIQSDSSQQSSVGFRYR